MLEIPHVEIEGCLKQRKGMNHSHTAGKAPENCSFHLMHSHSDCTLPGRCSDVSPTISKSQLYALPVGASLGLVDTGCVTKQRWATDTSFTAEIFFMHSPGQAHEVNTAILSPETRQVTQTLGILLMSRFKLKLPIIS